MVFGGIRFLRFPRRGLMVSLLDLVGFASLPSRKRCFCFCRWSPSLVLIVRLAKASPPPPSYLKLPTFSPCPVSPPLQAVDYLLFFYLSALILCFLSAKGLFRLKTSPSMFTSILIQVFLPMYLSREIPFFYGLVLLVPCLRIHHVLDVFLDTSCAVFLPPLCFDGPPCSTNPTFNSPHIGLVPYAPSACPSLVFQAVSLVYFVAIPPLRSFPL